MNKLIFIFLALAGLFCMPVLAQSVEAEKAALNEMLKSGEIEGIAAREKSKLIEELAADGKYPNIVLDTMAGALVGYEFATQLPGMTKKEIYERARQWAAIAYNETDAVTKYESETEGKLIYKGYARIKYKPQYKGLFGITSKAESEVKCWHVIIVTVKDGAMKVEFRNLKYEFVKTEPEVVGGRYGYKTVLQEVFLEDMYPLVQGPVGNMRGTASLLTNTLAAHAGLHGLLVNYAKGKKADYGF